MNGVLDSWSVIQWSKRRTCSFLLEYHTRSACTFWKYIFAKQNWKHILAKRQSYASSDRGGIKYLLVTLRQGLKPHGFFCLSSVGDTLRNEAWLRLGEHRIWKRKSAETAPPF